MRTYTASQTILVGIGIYLIIQQNTFCADITQCHDRPEHFECFKCDHIIGHDIGMYQTHNIDRTQFTINPFEGARCIDGETLWTYDDTFCTTHGQEFGFKEGTYVFGLTRKHPTQIVYSLNCIYSNATLLQYTSTSKSDVGHKLAWVNTQLSIMNESVTTYATSNGTHWNSGASDIFGSLTNRIPKWKQVLIALRVNPTDSYKIAMEIASYFYHNTSSFELTCAQPGMERNLVCKFYEPC